jgi:hypothetical protein
MREGLKLFAGPVLLGLISGTAGCGHEMLLPAPRSSKPLPVVYTGKGVSTMGDLPPGTYQIPDSQVIISGHQKATRSPASLMFGVVGVLVANQIDKSGGKAAVKSSLDVLHLKLSPEADDDLKNLLAADEFKDHFTTTAVRGEPELEIDGSIVLTFVDETKVLPYVVLHVTLLRYAHNPELKEPSVMWSTRYMSSIGAPKPLEGAGSWTENNATALKTTVSAELQQAMHYMLADIETPTPRDESHRIVVTGHFPFIPDRFEILSYALGESGDSIVFAPKIGDASVLAGVLLVDKTQVAVREAKKDDRTMKMAEQKGT